MEFVKDVIILIKNVQNVLKSAANIVKKDFIQKTTLANNVLQFLKIAHFAVPLNVLLVQKEKSYRMKDVLKTVKKINCLKKEIANIAMKHFQIVRSALSWSAPNAVKIISC